MIPVEFWLVNISSDSKTTSITMLLSEIEGGFEMSSEKSMLWLQTRDDNLDTRVVSAY